MEVLMEKLAIFGSAALLCIVVVLIYLRKLKKESSATRKKIEQAVENGLHEPVSLHPVVDTGRCIKTGACVASCPEKDVLGIMNGKATVINAAHCVGHGACFHACPTEAISLRMGTESRGVELPHVNPGFESNIAGIYIAGELGGMGLIKNAVEQGRQAVENIARSLKKKEHQAEYDIVIIGAGPAGISGTLTAKKNNLKYLLLEQASLGGTVFTFPRKKIIMTSPMDLPLYGRLKLYETSKKELLDLWIDVLSKNNITVNENCKVDHVQSENGILRVKTSQGDFTSAAVLLAIGRRGSPRKLNIPGEMNEKVAYSLADADDVKDMGVVVVGGGDSAIEAALLLCERNRVTLSYRGEVLSRIKPANNRLVNEAIKDGRIDIKLSSSLTRIDDKTVTMSFKDGSEKVLENDLVYIFAGGELPSAFLEKTGITITKKFGEIIMKH